MRDRERRQWCALLGCDLNLIDLYDQKLKKKKKYRERERERVAVHFFIFCLGFSDLARVIA